MIQNETVMCLFDRQPWNLCVRVHWKYVWIIVFSVSFLFFFRASSENYRDLCASLTKLKAVRKDNCLRGASLDCLSLTKSLLTPLRFWFCNTPPSASLQQCSIVSKMQMYGSPLRPCDGERDLLARKWRVTCCCTVWVQCQNDPLCLEEHISLVDKWTNLLGSAKHVKKFEDTFFFHHVSKNGFSFTSIRMMSHLCFNKKK